MSVIPASTGEYRSQVVMEAVKKLYNDETTADVHFIFKTGERLPAHKYLLAAASDVFYAMFYGSIKEKGNVKIDDASAVGFMEFLQFFYFNTIRLTIENISDVMNLGQKYNITECSNLCVRFLIERLTSDNVCQIHSLAVLFERNDLKMECETFIKSHTDEVLNSPSFLWSDRSVLNYILKSDELLCAETQVFRAAMSWVKSVSKQEEVTKEIIKTYLGDLFHEIRFRSMTHDDFVDLLPSFGTLFDANELNEILRMLKYENYEPKIFNGFLRMPPWNEGAVIAWTRWTNFYDSYYEHYTFENVETTTFTTSKPLLLGYFVCIHTLNTSRTSFQEPLIDVTIIRFPKWVECNETKMSMSTVLCTIQAEMTGDFSENRRIKLPKPIIIDPKFKYEIRIDTSMLPSYLTDRGFNPIQQLDNGAILRFFDGPLINNEKTGLIRELGFNPIN